MGIGISIRMSIEKKVEFSGYPHACGVFHSGVDEISQHIVQFYIDNVTKRVAVPVEDRLVLIKCYKCALVGMIIDWLDNGASYDLSVFCERMLTLFAGSGKRAFLMHTEEAVSR